MNQAVQRCIFCLSDLLCGDHPPEHVFPDAIGGALQIRSVCGACNSFIGTQVDSSLVDDWFIRTRRYIHGIESRTGSAPNPFDHSRLEDGRKIRVRGKPGNTSLYIHPTRTERRTEDGYELEFIVDGADLPKVDGMIQRWTDRAARRHGRRPQMIGKRVVTEQVVNHPPVSMKLSLDLNQIERACAKVAYELAHEWLGSEVMFDDPGAAIRTWVMTGKKSMEIQSWLELGSHKIIYPIDQKWPTEHLAMMTQIDDRVAMVVRIFNTYTFGLEVARGLQGAVRSRFLVLDPCRRKFQEMTIDEALHCAVEFLRSENLIYRSDESPQGGTHND